MVGLVVRQRQEVVVVEEEAALQQHPVVEAAEEVEEVQAWSRSNEDQVSMSFLWNSDISGSSANVVCNQHPRLLRQQEQA